MLFIFNSYHLFHRVLIISLTAIRCITELAKGKGFPTVEAIYSVQLFM